MLEQLTSLSLSSTNINLLLIRTKPLSSFLTMTDEESQISQVVESFLSSRGIPGTRIPEGKKRTPDYLIPLPLRDVLMELKIKSDDPSVIAESEAVMELGSIASRSKPLRYMNNASGAISYGAKQMVEHDPNRACHHILWLHASGHDAYAHEEQLRFTLYGTQRLFSSERPELIHCYFFHDSEFWRHRKTIAAAFLSRRSSRVNINIQLCLNPYYERKTEFRDSEVFNALRGGMLDVEQEIDGIQLLLMDGSCDRKDKQGVLDYLRNKYALEDLQPFDLGYHVAGLNS